MPLERLGELLGGDGWRVDVGRYVVRLMNERTTFAIAPHADGGGFILDDVTGAGDLLVDTQLASNHLTALGVRHRFEIYDRDRMIAYFHHDWPRA